MGGGGGSPPPPDPTVQAANALLLQQQQQVTAAANSKQQAEDASRQGRASLTYLSGALGVGRNSLGLPTTLGVAAPPAYVPPAPPAPTYAQPSPAVSDATA